MMYETNLMGKTDCRVYTSFEAVDGLQKPWDDFVESAGGDIYQTYDWCRIWWKYYGQGRKLRLFFFREGGRLVAIVPMVVDSIGLWPLRWKVAKPLGADFTLMVVNPAVLPECSEEVFRLTNEHLLEHDRCSAVCWGPLASGHCLASKLSSGTPSCPLVERKEMSYTVFPLPETFEDYLGSLSQSTRKHFRRDHKNLSDQYDSRFQRLEDPLDHFEKFIQMHEEQWKKLNKLGHFGDWPDARPFHKDLALSHDRLGRLRLFCLYADGEPIVYRYLYRFGKQYHSILPARLCDPPWDKVGLGRLTHILTVEQAIAEGVHKIEAGRGHYSHKLKLGGRECPTFSAVFGRKGFWNLLKARSFCRISDFLTLVYYKFWFGRVAPKLPIPRSGLWRLWIRVQL